MKKIKWENIKDGDKIKVIEYYSSYGSNKQEEEYLVTAIQGKKQIRLIKEDGTEFFHGVNSSHEYYLV